MAVKLRLKRMGKKRQPVYKVVAADVRSPRDGKIIEAIGLYNPKTDPATIEISEERAIYWLNAGAQPTDTVKSLLSRKGYLLKRELVKQGLSEQQIEVKLGEWQKIQEAKEAQKNKETKKAKKPEGESSKEDSKEESVPEVKGTTSDETEEKNETTEEKG